jgi:hypothetical protein
MLYNMTIMSERLTFSQAKDLVGRIKNYGCDRPVAVAVSNESTKRPDTIQESRVFCKIKVAKTEQNENCTAVDGSYCPLSYSIQDPQNLRRS